MRLLLSLLGIASFVFLTSPTDAQNPQTGNSEVRQNTSVAPSHQPAAADATPLGKETTAREGKSQTDTWMVRLTAGLVIVGAAQLAVFVFQLVVFGLQARRLRESVEKMDEIGKAQAEDMESYITAASRSAVAMEKVAEGIGKNVHTTSAMAQTQRDFWERQMRAYVLPENANIWDGTTLDPPQPARKGIPGVVLAIRNSGATPAYSVVSWAAIDVIDVKNEHALTAPTPLQPQFTNTLAPHGLFTKAIWFHRALTPHEISDIATGVRGIYVYGRVEYRDVLEKDRFSDFRVRYSGAYPPQKGAIFNFSDTGNNAN